MHLEEFVVSLPERTTIMMNEATSKFIQEHRHDDVRQLAFKTTTDKEVDLHAALEQIKGFQMALKKLPEWSKNENVIYPPHLSMEQCSSERTGRYKQDLVRRLTRELEIPNHSFIDLTAGFGVDFYYIGQLFHTACYVEQQPLLCRIARHNFKELGLNNVEFIEGNAIEDESLWKPSDVCFIDPARRDGTGRKTVAIEDCEPDISVIQEQLLANCQCCLIKLSPMLDIHATTSRIRNIREIHAVSVHGECKELLLVLTHLQHDAPIIFHCANLSARDEHFTFDAEEELHASCQFTSQPGKYLYEPNASIMKCGGFRTLSKRFGLEKLHPNSHLYTSDKHFTDFPGRIFKIRDICSFNKKDLRRGIQNIQQANLSIRNFPSTVSDLRKRLKLREGGDHYIFATTLSNEQHVLIIGEKMTDTSRM